LTQGGAHRQGADRYRQRSAPPDRAVENGLSCISCHAARHHRESDQVRAHVLKNKGAFAEGTLETLWPCIRRRKDGRPMRADAKRFRKPSSDRGAADARPSRSLLLAIRFEAELDLPLAAAEAGVTPPSCQGLTLIRISASSLAAAR